MLTISKRWVQQIIFLAIIAGILGGCGVRGNLDPPSGQKPKKDQPFILDKVI